MPDWRMLWNTQVLSNSVGDWTLALAAFLVTLTVLPLLRGVIAARRRRWQEAHVAHPVAIEIATLLIERTMRLFLWGVGFYIAVELLSLPARIEHTVKSALVFIFWFQMGIWAMTAVRYAVARHRSQTSEPVLAGSLEIVLFIVGLIIWTTVFLLALDNLGVEIKPLLAGLGIGGIAVALALQAVLSDLLASVSIALDKPFNLGDSLTIDTFSGTVEHIGIKSTRLRSISGEQIILSNADVLKSRVRNFGRMRERSCGFQLYVVYDTPPETLRQIPLVVRQIVESQPNTRFERCALILCGPTALQFEVLYYVQSPDYRIYAELQQIINVAILERFRALKIQFATLPLMPAPALPPAPP